MTNIRLVYNPFTGQTRIYNENQEITAKENRLCAFLCPGGFESCLLPFRRRYTVWEGLLPELLRETNDEELHVIFEGRDEDFRKMEEAFEQTRSAVENAGYENRWQLTHIPNFEAGNLVRQLRELAAHMREMCESRRELSEIDRLAEEIGEENLDKNCQSMQAVLCAHIAKWEQSQSEYRQGKITYLKMLEGRLREAEKQAGRL